MNLNKRLRAEARKAGLCDAWFEGWGKPDKQGLVEKALRGMNFVCEHDFPSLSFIKAHFEEALLEKNHFHIDKALDAHNEAPCVGLSGRCTGRLLYDGFTVSSLYIRHESEVEVEVGDFARLFVQVYDKARVKIRQSGRARVYLYKNGSACEVETEGDVRTRERGAKEN